MAAMSAAPKANLLMVLSSPSCNHAAAAASANTVAGTGPRNAQALVGFPKGAATAPIGLASFAAAAWLYHPFGAAESLECLVMKPDLRRERVSSTPCGDQVGVETDIGCGCHDLLQIAAHGRLALRQV